MTVTYRDAAEFREVQVSIGEWRPVGVLVFAHPWRDKAVVFEELPSGEVRKIVTRRSRCEVLR